MPARVGRAADGEAAAQRVEELGARRAGEADGRRAGGCRSRDADGASGAAGAAGAAAVVRAVNVTSRMHEVTPSPILNFEVAAWIVPVASVAEVNVPVTESRRGVVDSSLPLIAPPETGIGTVEASA